MRAVDGGRVIEVANQGIFDELVVDDWLHLEQLDEHKWWMRVGDASLNIEILPEGQVRLVIERDVHAAPLSLDKLRPLVEDVAKRTMVDYDLPAEMAAKLTWSTPSTEGGPWDFSLCAPRAGTGEIEIVARFRANPYTGEVLPLIVNLPKKPG